MATGPLGGVVDYLRQVAAPPDAGGQSDRALVLRFVEERDESAFAALVQRHGPMVLGVCLRVLGDEHDAEDAFQATFLVLARRAGSVRRQESVGSWLYGVAYRTALKARTTAARRRAREQQARAMTSADPEATAAWQELRPLLDAELDQLPEKYRAPLVLCYLEGKTNEEAARLLGWTKGTVSGRLARARDLLRGRLTRRGLTLTSALLATALAEGTASAAVPMSLAISTVKAAVAGAAPAVTAGLVSAHTAALAEGVSHAMFLGKLKAVVITLATVALLGSGGGLVTYHALAAGPGDQPTARPASAPTDQDELTRLREENRRLRLELARTKRALAALKAIEAQRSLDEAKRAAQAAAIEVEVDRQKVVEERAFDLREAAARTLSANHLRQIGLAMHNYHDVYAHFPTAAIYSKEGKPLLSWRVAILPYIEQQELYKQFHLDEPWDSAHNKKLLAQMPPVYAPVRGKAKKGYTYYQVFTGKGTIFPGRKTIRFQDITDGTSNTILAVEAGTAVPWTKPADLPFKAGAPLPKLGGMFGGGFNLLMADGSTRFVRAGFNAEILRALITRNGGEVVDTRDLNKK
jgi:RNA polymerase sigma factor (sigma-70 family)